MSEKYRDGVYDNVCVNEDNETPIMSFDKVTSNECYAVGLAICLPCDLPVVSDLYVLTFTVYLYS